MSRPWEYLPDEDLQERKKLFENELEDKSLDEWERKWAREDLQDIRLEERHRQVHNLVIKKHWAYRTTAGQIFGPFESQEAVEKWLERKRPYVRAQHANSSYRYHGNKEDGSIVYYGTGNPELLRARDP